MKQASKVIIADAGLKNRHILDIKRMSKRPLSGKTLFPVWRKGILMKRIIQALREGKRISVPTSSKGYAKILKDKINKELPRVNVGIYTAEETCEMIEDPVTLWSQHQCIIYTGTIVSGNSYTEMVDEVYGYFMTKTADYEDMMKMLLRCRNVGSGRIYVCVETKGPRKKIIPNDVRAKISSIREYLLDEDVLARGYLESEEYKLPIDLLKFTDTGEIDPKGTYFNLYCGYIKDLVLQQRASNFLLMLALRDQGMKFGGYLGRMEYDEEAQELERDMMKKSKEINENDRRNMSKLRDLTDDEAKTLMNKDKTHIEVLQLRKYKLNKEYGVEVTEELIKKTRGMHLKHNNLVKCARVSGMEDERQRQGIMAEIGNNILHTVDIEERMETNNKLMRIKECYHALNLLKILNLGNFLDRLQSKTIITLDERMRRIMDEYIVQYADEMRHILKLDQDELEPKNRDILRIANELIYQAFGIEVVTVKKKDKNDPDSFYMKSIWMKHEDLIIPRGVIK